MNGLALSERYYLECCSPMLEERFPALHGRPAAGLVGDGSECFGFDDELSRDHDWGAAVCLWLVERDYARWGEALRSALASLPDTFDGFPVKKNDRSGAGVWEIGDFYFKYLGQTGVPPKAVDWLAAPEENFATATNGVVFADPLGEFTRIRKGLLAFYPEDVRRKKLAAGCARMAQAGQYNFPRCVARGEYAAATMAEARFLDAACSVAFLLNKKYKPFYKWMHRALRGLPLLGDELHTKIAALAAVEGEKTHACRVKTMLIEDICAILTFQLGRLGLSDAKGDFLLEHALALQSGIEDDELRGLDVLIG